MDPRLGGKQSRIKTPAPGTGTCLPNSVAPVPMGALKTAQNGPVKPNCKTRDGWRKLSSTVVLYFGQLPHAGCVPRKQLGTPDMLRDFSDAILSFPMSLEAARAVATWLTSRQFERSSENSSNVSVMLKHFRGTHPGGRYAEQGRRRRPNEVFDVPPSVARS